MELVSKDQLRRIFADARIEERAANGELTEIIIYRELPSPQMNLPDGTMSERTRYIDANGQTVAEAHHYEAITSRGRQTPRDPKIVVHEGTTYYCDA